MARPITNTTDMPDSAILAKHLALRGTEDLKYMAGTSQPRCTHECNLYDVPPYKRGPRTNQPSVLVGGGAWWAA